MPSFDVVSKINWHEVDNALGQTTKEIAQRFDFKGSNTVVELKDGAITIESADDFKVNAAREVLESKLAKRQVPLGALDRGKVEPAAGARARQVVKVKSGIETEVAKKIVKSIKDAKLKVQAAIHEDSVRVSGKKRDDLQAVIAHLKAGDFGQPLQYENFRD